MAHNISKLLAAIAAKAANADSSDTLLELNRISQATTLANDIKQARIYSAYSSLPTADSSNVGDIVRVGSVFDSDITKYYVSHNDKWKLITLQDSASIDQSVAVYSFQGSNFGYNSGGSGPPASTDNYIQKYSFVSDANAIDVGDTSTANLNYASGQSSKTHGYISHTTIIDKFSFSADGNATDVGNLSVSRTQVAGHNSETEGYSSGGVVPPFSNVIDKFPFASDGTATDVGDLTVVRAGASGTSSSSHGYTSGGSSPSFSNVIDKFSFTSDANASDVGDLTVTRGSISGNDACSSDNGYTSGGNNPGRLSSIDKFPFAADTNATDVGDLTQTVNIKSNSSSTTSGYRAGGQVTTPVPAVNVIDKWPFASDGTATDVGDLVEASKLGAGQQY